MSRERDIRNAIKAALDGTNEFDAEGVFLGTWEERGRAASVIRGAAVHPEINNRWVGWDAAEDGGWAFQLKIPIEIAVRDDDPIRRDEECERLANIVSNTITGVSLASLSLLQLTLVESTTWMPPHPPERRIKAMLSAPYIVDGWDSEDTTE